jgi:hypothetical protein
MDCRYRFPRTTRKAPRLRGHAFGVAYAADHETEFLADIDTLIKGGEHSVASATTAVFKQKIPVFGATIGAGIVVALDSLEPQAENGAKVGYDKGLEYLKGLSAKLEAA